LLYEDKQVDQLQILLGIAQAAFPAGEHEAWTTGSKSCASQPPSTFLLMLEDTLDEDVVSLLE